MIKIKNLFCIFLLFFALFSILPAKTETKIITIEPAETHQTIEGFGASIAWYEKTLANHPNKEDIYYYIFNNLGLSILRLRNVYRNDPNNFAADFASIVDNMYNIQTVSLKS